MNKRKYLYYGVGAAGIYLLTRKPKTVRVARRYVGQLELTTGAYERGFKNPAFEKLMRQYGWLQGYDWCAIFVRAVILQSFSGEKRNILKTLVTSGTQRTYNNLLHASQKYSWITLHTKPVPGAIAVWQSVNNPQYGHIGIIEYAAGNQFISIEGNVSTGTGFDGVARKQHSLSERNKTTGKRLRKYFIKIR